MELLVSIVRNAKLSDPSKAIRLPGDRRIEARIASAQNGLFVARPVAEELANLAAEHGLAIPWTRAAR